MPRLPDFFSKHPKVSVSCAIRLSPFDFETDPFDAAIHYGSPIWAGAVVHHLMDEDIVPVCSPSFKTSRRIRRVEDLTRAPLLHLTTRPAAWADWFARGEVPAANAFQGSIFENFAMISKAAMAGLGVPLLPTYFIEEELKEGTLVALAHSQRSKKAYYLVILKPKSERRTSRRLSNGSRRSRNTTESDGIEGRRENSFLGEMEVVDTRIEPLSEVGSMPLS